MSLKLIRAAIRATTKNPDILIAEEVRSVIKSKGLPLVESDLSMEITRDDYNRWLAVVLDEAKQRGLTLTTNKADFEDIAMGVLDNDPKIESQPGNKETTKEGVIATMWHAFQATRGHAGTTNRVKKAREDEQLGGFAQDFRKSQGIEDEQKRSSLVKDAVGCEVNNPYEPGSLRHSLWTKMHGTAEDEELHTDHGIVGDDDMDADAEPTADQPVDNSEPDQDSDVDTSAADDDQIEGGEDVDLDADEQDDIDPEEALASLSTEDLEAELARRRGEDGDDEADTDEDTVSAADADTDADQDADQGGDMPASKDDTQEDSPEAIAARITREDEQEVKDPILHTLTRPRDELRDAHKAIEKNGQDAWRNVNLPKNPHPANSHAHKLWNKGLINIAKAALGIKDPVLAAAKKKRR